MKSKVQTIEPFSRDYGKWKYEAKIYRFILPDRVVFVLSYHRSELKRKVKESYRTGREFDKKFNFHFRTGKWLQNPLPTRYIFDRRRRFGVRC
jgi:hypothetical protein